MSLIRKDSVRGQTAAEFAIVALLLLTMIFGIIQFAQLLNAYELITEAAQEGSRYAMVRGSSVASPATTADVQGIVQTRAAALNAASMTITPAWTPNNNPGSIVSVQVTYKFKFAAGFVSPSVTLSTSSQMTITQ